MTLALDGTSLDPAGVARGAREGASVELAQIARGRNAAAYRASLRLARNGATVYGLSTGVGAMCTASVDPSAHTDHQLRLLRSHASAAGALLADDVVRATMIVRANQLGAGGAGVHPELLDALLDALVRGVLPAMRELGSVGTGDLAALAELGLVLVGERAARVGVVARAAPLGPRDGLALISSNARAIAEAALACHDLGHLVRDADACAALAFEAAGADPIVLDPRVHAARPHAGQVACAARMRRALAGYARSHDRVQDSFAFRCAAQVHGTLAEAHAQLERTLVVELNAAAENPLVVGDDALANGNFHAALLAASLDFARNAAARVASLSAARLGDLLDARVTGLAPFLAQTPGLDSGLMALEYVARDSAAEIALLSAPTVGDASLSHGVENHVSWASLAARATTRTVERLRSVLATEVLAAVRALRLRDVPPAGEGTLALFGRLAPALSAVHSDRPLTDDLDTATALLRAGALR